METLQQSKRANHSVAASNAVSKNAMPGLIRRKSLVASIAKPPVVQPKLKVNRPGDKFEQEADAVADKVMRMDGRENTKKSIFPSAGEDKNSLPRNPSHFSAERQPVNRIFNAAAPFSPAIIHRKEKKIF